MPVSWFAFHYPGAHGESYDEATAFVLEGVRGALAHAQAAAATLARNVETIADRSAVVERCAERAFVVDGLGMLRTANGAGEAALREGGIVRESGRRAGGKARLSLADPLADAWLRARVAELAAGYVIGRVDRAFATRAGLVRVRAFLLPRDEACASLLVPLSPRVLVLIGTDRIDATEAEDALVPVGAAFGLSAAESRVSARLLMGRSVPEIAAENGSSEGTVRQQLKSIFRKTGTHRQGELVSLLARFA